MCKALQRVQPLTLGENLWVYWRNGERVEKHTTATYSTVDAAPPSEGEPCSCIA
jgi:hypothetical protein